MSLGQLSAEQRSVLEDILGYGKSEGQNPTEILSAVETGLVEETLHNLPYGTGTSVGWRQDTSEHGTVAQRLDLAVTIPEYFREADAHYTPGINAGVLAQDAQGSDYPERYGEHEGEAEALIREAGGVLPAGGQFSSEGLKSPLSAASSSKPGESFDTLTKWVLYAAIIGGAGVIVFLGIRESTRPPKPGAPK